MIDMASSAVNPLRAGMRTARTVEPATMVIFGATGDLTHRKLLPALYNLTLEHPIPPQFSIVGVARRPLTHEEVIEASAKAGERIGRILREVLRPV